MKFRALVILFVCAMLGFGACTNARVLEASNPAALRTDDDATLRAAIFRALAVRGWTVKDEAPGLIVATVRAGGHEATVAVHHDGRGYAIFHQDSSPGLKFTGQTIHKRYNRWVANLDASIRKELLNAQR